MDKKEYNKWLKEQKKLAEKFKLSVDDIHNLLDLSFMIDWRTYETLKLNKMDKWFKGFFERIENIALNDLIEKRKKK